MVSNSQTDATDGENITPTRVLFCTPTEIDIWQSIVALESDTVLRQRRIPIPENPEEVVRRWKPPTLQCTDDEYVEVLKKFFDAGVIEMVGRAGGSNNACRFVQPSGSYHVVSIEERREKKIPSTYLEIIQRVQKEVPCFRTDILGRLAPIHDWFSSHFPAVHPRTVQSKIFGFKPGDQYKGWGVVIEVAGVHQFLVTVNGFGPYDFASNGRPLIRVNRGVAKPEPEEDSDTDSDNGVDSDGEISPEASAVLSERISERLQALLERQDASDLYDLSLREADVDIERLEREFDAVRTALEQRRADRDDLVSRSVAPMEESEKEDLEALKLLVDRPELIAVLLRNIT